MDKPKDFSLKTFKVNVTNTIHNLKCHASQIKKKQVTYTATTD